MSVLIGALIGFAGGMTNHFLWYRIPIPPLGNPLVAIYVAAVAFSIVRYRFFDIEVIIKKAIVFAGIVMAAACVISLPLGFLQLVIGRAVGIPPFWLMVSGIVTVVLVYRPLEGILINLTDRYLFQQKIDYETIEEDVSNSIKITDLDKLCQSLVNIFYEGMKLTRVILFLYDEEKKEFRIGAANGTRLKNTGGQADCESPLVLKDSDSLIQELRNENTGTVVLKAELKDRQKQLSEGLEALECEALAKVVFENRLIALLCLGKKKSDEDFALRDRQLLLKTANQMAVSVSHANTFRLQRDYYVLQAQRNKSDALSNLSSGLGHEVKNPLNQIRPRIELLIDAYENKSLRPDDPAVLENLQTQLRHVDRIIKIMDRLSRFARPLTGGQARPTEGEAVQLGPVSLKPFAEEAIGLTGEQLGNDDIKVEVEIADNLPPIYADETSLVQVFYNLIINAYHAIDRNGTIRISARANASDNKVCVEVADTGKGISPDIMDRIFEPFFTTKPTNAGSGRGERFTGTGLGLAFVKRYVEELGGSISVASEMDKGTTFYLHFLKVGGDREIQSGFRRSPE